MQLVKTVNRMLFLNKKITVLNIKTMVNYILCLFKLNNIISKKTYSVFIKLKIIID